MYALPIGSYNYDVWIPLNELERFGDERNVIYCIRNVLNDKRYVGQTSNTLVSRLRGHVYDATVNCSRFTIHTAIRKHGVESFEVTILERCEDSTALNELEVKHVNEQHALIQGYNMTVGGDGIRGFKHSLQTRKLISKRRSKPISERARSAIQKPVLQFSLQTGAFIARYASMNKARIATGASNISGCCRGVVRHSRGFVWRYENVRDAVRGSWSDQKRNAMVVKRQKENPLCRSVMMIDLEGNVVKTFSSVKEARRKTGINNVSRAARTNHTAGGFNWKYA